MKFALALALTLLSTGLVPVQARTLADIVHDLDVVVGIASHGPLLALAGEGGGRILIVEHRGEEFGLAASFGSPLPHLEPGPGALAMALSSDTLLVGAGYADSAARYVRTDEGWRLDAVLRGAAGSGFGASVDLAGDLAAIGAPFAAVRGGGQGSVQLFEVGQAGWSAQGRLTLTDGAYGDRFGASVAFGDDAVAVGAPGRYLEPSRSGLVSVFAVDGGGELARVHPLPGVPAVGFGSSVAADSVRLVVSGDDEGGGETGGVHVYRWGRPESERPTLLGWEGVDSADLHGTALLLSDGRLAVSGRRELDELGANLYITFYGLAESGWQALESVDVGVSYGDRWLELADLGSELLVVLRQPDRSAPGPSAWWRLVWP